MDQKRGTQSGEQVRKGVTATPHDIQGQQHEEDPPQKDGVDAVKIDLRTVIDAMGPHTPSHLTRSTSSEANAEESYSRSHKTEKPNSSIAAESETTEDISEMSTLISDSVGVKSYTKECGTSTWSGESSAVRNHVKNCPCRMYNMRSGLTAGDDKYRGAYRQSPNKNLAPSKALLEVVNKSTRQTRAAGGDPSPKNFANRECAEEFRRSGSQSMDPPRIIPNRPGQPKMFGVFSKMFAHNPLHDDNNRRGSKDKAMLMLSNLFKFKRASFTKDPLELYRINIAQNAEQSPPKKIVFELIDDLPRPDTNTVATNTIKGQSTRRSGVQVDTFPGSYNNFYPNQAQQSYSLFGNKQSYSQNYVNENRPSQQSPPPLGGGDAPTKVDVYYFDHGNASYYRTTDQTPVLTTEIVAERTENYTMRFWAQFYGTVHIGFAFFTSFVLQTLRFLLQSLFRPLCVGLVQLGSDYFFKPFLAVLFNAILQPVLIFFYNVATSLRDLLDPVAEGIGYFLREVANIFRACRLVEVKKGNCSPQP